MDIITLILLLTVLLLIAFHIASRGRASACGQCCKHQKPQHGYVHKPLPRLPQKDHIGGNPQDVHRSSTISKIPVSQKMNSYISEIDNANGVIYRQHQREFKHLVDINRHKKKRNQAKLVGEFIGRQRYIEEHIDDIRRELLVKHMRKIQPYMENPIRHADMVRENCEDALSLAKDLNSEEDIKIIQAVLARVSQPTR